MKGFAAAQKAYDNMLPPEPEEDVECFECGELMSRYKVGPDDGWVCNACGCEVDDREPDYDAYFNVD